jgi:hypothetical protein
MTDFWSKLTDETAPFVVEAKEVVLDLEPDIELEVVLERILDPVMAGLFAGAKLWLELSVTEIAMTATVITPMTISNNLKCFFSNENTF